MEKKGVGALTIAAAYIGTVVGAGFATGQEVLQFFAAFGARGLWGILISTALFIVFGVIIMELGFTLGAKSHLEILRHSGGRVFGAVMDWMISFFLFASLMAMTAGTGALFVQQFRLSWVLGSVVMAVITAVTVLGGFSGVINSISAVVPFLLTAVIGVSVFSILHSPPTFLPLTADGGNPVIGNWLFSSVLYASYNIIMSVSVLAPLGAAAKDKKALKTGAVLGGAGLGLASVMIFFALSGNAGGIEALEVPLTYIAGKISPLAQTAFALVLIAEIYTTAVGSLFGMSARIAEAKRAPNQTATVIGSAAAACLAGMLGFSNIVKYIYPLVGYCGIALLVNLLYIKIKPYIVK